MTAILDLPILPRLLYRYRRLTDATIDQEIAAVRLNYLWFSAYRALNDPMEGFYEATTRVQASSTYKQLTSEILQAKRQIGICCFSDTKHSELMWVHYASDYAGICIGYDPDLLVKALPDGVHLLRMAYGSRPPDIGKSDAQNAAQAAIKILSHKKDNWAHEREWRLLGPLERVNIASAACAKEIYFGPRIQPHHRTKLKTQLAGLSLQFSRTLISGYGHEFKKIA